MMITVKNIQVADNNCLVIEFSDSKTKSVDLTFFLEKGIFSQLKDQGYFRLVKNTWLFYHMAEQSGIKCRYALLLLIIFSNLQLQNSPSSWQQILYRHIEMFKTQYAPLVTFSFYSSS